MSKGSGRRQEAKEGNYNKGYTAAYPEKPKRKDEWIRVNGLLIIKGKGK